MPNQSLVTDLAWAPDGCTLAVAGSASSRSVKKESCVVLFAVAGDGSQVQQKQHWVTSAGVNPEKDSLHAITFVADDSGRYLAGVSDGGACRVWRTADGRCLRTFYSDAPLTHLVTYMEEGDCVLACGGSNGAMHLLRVKFSGSYELDELPLAPEASVQKAAGRAEKGQAQGIFAALGRVFAFGVGLGDALALVEDQCMAVAGRALATADDCGGECVVCMDMQRSVRFACGHCVCCSPCADRWQRVGGGCPVCRAKVRIVQRRLEGGQFFEKQSR